MLLSLLIERKAASSIRRSLSLGEGMCRAVLFMLALLFALVPGAVVGITIVPPRTGFPVTLPGGGVTVYSKPLVADLDNDGKKEIVVGTDGTSTSGGLLFVVNSDGKIRSGWPKVLPSPINSSPAAGNLLGLADGSLQIVVGCGSALASDGRPGGVYVFRPDGRLVWSIETTFTYEPDGVWSTPALGDLDGDGLDDVVFGSFNEHVYALKGSTGASLPGWPVWIRDQTWSSPVLADLDGDGKLEIIIGAYTHKEPPPINNPDGGALWVLRADGTLFPGFPQFAPELAGAMVLGITSSPAVGDIDGDGCPEIVVGMESQNSNSGRTLLAYHNDGTTVAGFPYALAGHSNASPALADLDGDGVLDVVISDDGNVYQQTIPTPYLYALKCNGEAPGPAVSELFRMRPKVVTGDDATEIHEPIIARANGTDSVIMVGGAGFEVTLVSKTGVQLTADSYSSPLPVYSTGHPVVGAAVADIDGNGTLYLVAASGVGASNSTDSGLYVWPLGAAGTTPMPWPMFHRDTRRAGWSHTAATPGSCKPALKPTKFYPILPCRVSDTRLSGNLCFGGPAFSSGESRAITVADNAVQGCGVAADAKAVALNVTVTQSTYDGYLSVFPSGQALPVATTLNFRAGRTRANNAVIPLSYEGRGNVTVYVKLAQPTGTADVILDVSGYFR